MDLDEQDTMRNWQTRGLRNFNLFFVHCAVCGQTLWQQPHEGLLPWVERSKDWEAEHGFGHGKTEATDGQDTQAQ